MNPRVDTSRLFYPAMLLLFTASGFAGLIYESIWSHYLKLFLGHAAYAQTLVLAIFMGGMALGAWLCSRYAVRWKDLILVYGVIEGLIGLAALVFHDVYVFATGVAFEQVIPNLGSAGAVQSFKWAFGALLILPQSVLLGMTFPLMTAGVLRAEPHRSGRAIAMLYFSNSLGAGFGVLASAFFLIPTVGLPGALAASAVVNLGVAAAVILMRRTARAAPVAAAASAARAAPGDAPSRGMVLLLLLVAALTGASSFIYEIGWIRMLALVLGSSTHAFEIMLSAFIFGLAFGGLWVRRRIDVARDTMRLLGFVQIAMGVAAVATLPIYGSTFPFMQTALEALSPTEAGYTAFHLVSHGISLAVMFPATFCAGMTLPLITATLLRAGSGERAIGQVYAANTAGSIVGVLLAVHIGFALLGLKGLIMAGAAVDLVLGVVLLGMAPGGARKTLAWGGAVFSVAVLAVVGLAVHLNPYYMASGVYRRISLLNPNKTEVIEHIDGKTTTVNITRSNAMIAFHNNGKSDGSVSLNPENPSNDEVTMTLMGTIPILIAPDAKRVANIGFGSGLTVNAILASPSLEVLDTIEIESAVVQAAAHFRPYAPRAFSDPRSKVHVEDAKTFFASQRSRYDIIISEPSNPWVSGVASLFTGEFYKLARSHLREGGLFVQWVQMYEFSPPLLASVITALRHEFSDYTLWASNDGDLIIVAVNGGKVPEPQAAAFKHPEIAKDLARFRIRGPEDLKLHWIGRRQTLDAYFTSFGVEPNSDYFPIVDQNAARARFMRVSATSVTDLAHAPVPVIQMFERTSAADSRLLTPGARPWLGSAQVTLHAKLAVELLLGGSKVNAASLPISTLSDVTLIRAGLLECRSTMPEGMLRWSLADLAQLVNRLPVERTTEIWGRLANSPCSSKLSEPDRQWLRLHRAVAMRRYDDVTRAAEALLQDSAMPPRLKAHALAALMAGHILAGRSDQAIRAFNTQRGGLRPVPEWQPMFSFLVAHAATGSIGSKH